VGALAVHLVGKVGDRLHDRAELSRTTSASSRTITFLATQAKPRARVVLTSMPSSAPREWPLEGERGYERGDRSREADDRDRIGV
jgi:hypothetical protein